MAVSQNAGLKIFHPEKLVGRVFVEKKVGWMKIQFEKNNKKSNGMLSSPKFLNRKQLKV